MKKEPSIADLTNGLFTSNLNFKLENELLNEDIDNALNCYLLKHKVLNQMPNGKLLMQDKNNKKYPVLIDYKGQKNNLVKFDKKGQVEIKTIKKDFHFKNINSYAINSVVYYANAILHYSNYEDIIAIGTKDYKKFEVYYVSKDNCGVGQRVGTYTDLSFLEKFDEFIEKVKKNKISQQKMEILKEQKEQEIEISLFTVNDYINKNEKALNQGDRVNVVIASIISTLCKTNPLKKSDLKSDINRIDGDIMIEKIKQFLNEKKISKDKQDFVIQTLQNTLTTENINKVENGESQLKRIFIKVVDELGIYYKIGLTTDFTGKLFNEMYGWLGFSSDKLNDIVLTPPYVATLLVKLARINKDSYVWDFATGSAGLLMAAINEMLNDAKNTITSSKELTQKELKIKAEQILGLELFSDVHLLAILNMILIGDGDSNILNKNSLEDFNNNDEQFPADTLILNPPYSAEGNGMIFVEKALNMMKKGYAAIIIQNSAGAGKAIEFNKRILKTNSLLASIKMPIDIFIGKASVQTYIYVFKINEKHNKNAIVKFIDFSNDGYTRTNRKKTINNLKDTDNAKQRYKELVELVFFGKEKLNLFTDKEYYENVIDPINGADWNQNAPIDTIPTLEDFKKTVSDHLIWQISSMLKQDIELSVGK